MGYFFNSLLKYGFQKKENGGGGGEITVDSELSENSKNPVQNKVITSTLQKKITKFFSANDNLEPGEIAQYQGEDDSVNGLKNGFFYKKETTAGLVLPVGTKVFKDFSFITYKREPILYLIDVWNNPQINTFWGYNIDNKSYYIQVFPEGFNLEEIPEPFKTAFAPFSELSPYELITKSYLTQLQATGAQNAPAPIEPQSYDFYFSQSTTPNWVFGNEHNIMLCCDPEGNRYINNGMTLFLLDDNNKLHPTTYFDNRGVRLSLFNEETTEEINFLKVTFTQVDTQPQPQQPQTEKNIFVVNAQSINTNINECLSVLTELKTNDLIIFSDIDETKIYNYTYNSTTKNFKGNADFDLIFRYAGNGEFKPISFSPILV